MNVCDDHLSQNPDDKEIGYSNVLANARPFEHMFFFGGSSFTSLTTSNHVTDKRTHPLCDFMQHKLTSLEDADIISTNSVDLSIFFLLLSIKRNQRAESRAPGHIEPDTNFQTTNNF